MRKGGEAEFCLLYGLRDAAVLSWSCCSHYTLDFTLFRTGCAPTVVLGDDGLCRPSSRVAPRCAPVPTQETQVSTVLDSP